jgi:hypothetical protein
MEPKTRKALPIHHALSIEDLAVNISYAIIVAELLVAVDKSF